MEKIKNSLSGSSLRDQQTGLDLDLSGADSSTASSCTSQLEFDSATNSGITLPETIQTKCGKSNKQPIRRIQKMWTQEEKRTVMECYYSSKPKINWYLQQMLATWRDKGMFNTTEQRLGLN